MLMTIAIGTCVSIQGTFVRRLSNGHVVVRDGTKTFVGRPVEARAA